MATRVWRILLCSPFSATGLRLAEIVQAIPNYDLVGLVGSQRRYLPRLPSTREASQFKCEGRLVLDAGWAPAPLSNKSIGVSLVLGTRFRLCHIQEVQLLPKHFRVEG